MDSVPPVQPRGTEHPQQGCSRPSEGLPSLPRDTPAVELRNAKRRGSATPQAEAWADQATQNLYGRSPGIPSRGHQARAVAARHKADRKAATQPLVIRLTALRRAEGVAALVGYCTRLLDTYEHQRQANGLPEAHRVDWSNVA